ncbi:PD-(D/E)XK nuclease family protein [Zhihengliuella flava]|uniref:Cytochrome n=1 Tax=Zhihengliuella flava TaxID=1285193 RepID=A0A931GMS5_9MICC|nr:PD-(D/E)XK nuclease family protein [Zhihengliuella flava]MBG6085714.1 hypothetical protein [Zhihengliuella flava]
MTTPALAQQTDLGRMYARRIGGTLEVPSITTVIGVASPDLTGWAGHMAATAVVGDRRLAHAVGDPRSLKQIARDAAGAAERYRDDAAARGDRVHDYAEQVALAALGQTHHVDAARAALATHGESAFAERFDEWWRAYGVEPVAAEVTVWNHEVGYAGTLDLVARVGGRLCLIDFKTKSLTRDGRAKPLDEKVIMQLVAGYKAEEMCTDAASGTWVPWPYGDEPPLLLAVAIAETEAVALQAHPASLPVHWRRFWALKQAWSAEQQLAATGPGLRPVPPPSVAPSTV